MNARAVIFTPYQTYERRYLIAAQRAGMELHASPSLQEWSSQLFRDQDAIGILWARGGTSAAETIRRTRLGNVRNPIVALIQYMDFAPHRVAEAHIEALAAGADDAQSMDIDVEELASRLFVVARRVRGAEPSIEFAGCAYDPSTGTITGPGGTVYLTKMKAAMLEALARHPGKVCTKLDLMSALYGGRDEPESKIIDVFVCKLRASIMEATGGLDCVETVWGRGYSWNPAGYQPRMAIMRKRGKQIPIRNQAS